MIFEHKLHDEDGYPRGLTHGEAEVLHSTPAGLLAEVLSIHGPIGLDGLTLETRQYQLNNPLVGCELGCAGPLDAADVLDALEQMLQHGLAAPIEQPAQPCGGRVLFTCVRPRPERDLHPVTAAVQRAMPSEVAYDLDAVVKAVRQATPGQVGLRGGEIVRGLSQLVSAGVVLVATQPASAVA